MEDVTPWDKYHDGNFVGWIAYLAEREAMGLKTVNRPDRNTVISKDEILNLQIDLELAASAGEVIDLVLKR